MASKGPPLPPIDPMNPPQGMKTLTDVLMFQCAPDQPWVWVGAIGWSAIFAIWTVISPGWKDAAKFGGEGSWLHKGRWALEETDFQRPTWVMKGEAAMFELGEALDIFAFFFMLGEAIVDGLIDATSMIWQFSPCARPIQYTYYFSKTQTGLYINSDPPTWQNAVAWTNGYSSSGDPDLGAEISIPANSTLAIGYHVSFANIFGGAPRPVDVRLIDLDKGLIYKQTNWNPENNDGKASNLGFVKQIATGNDAMILTLQVRTQQVYPDIGTWPNEGHIAVEIVTRP